MKKNLVSIPLKSGLIVILTLTLNADYLLTSLNPLEIGSNCNMKYLQILLSQGFKSQSP